MATRRAMQGVLRNFLGAFTSRYSDFDGYWLFGFLVGGLGELRIDLLAAAVDKAHTPVDLAAQRAAITFEDQWRKAGLARSQIREAWLVMRRSAASVRGSINGHPCDGYQIRFSAVAVMTGSQCYEREQVEFVAPHDANLERQSNRACAP